MRGLAADCSANARISRSGTVTPTQLSKVEEGREVGEWTGRRRAGRSEQRPTARSVMGSRSTAVGNEVLCGVLMDGRQLQHLPWAI
jgi:hypothetical protein